MSDLNDQRTFYEHDIECKIPEDLMPVNERGLRGCKGCAGVFKADGVTGVATTSKLFDPEIPENIDLGEE